MKTLSWGAQRLLKLLKWFDRKCGEIRTGQRFLADRLGCSTRSISRWFAELREAGAKVLQWRGPHPPFLSVDGVAFGDPFGAASLFTQSEHLKPIKQNTANAPSSGSEPEKGCAAKIPLGYGEKFAEYVAVFDRARKPRNDHDVKRAHGVWIGIGFQHWEPAIADAKRLARETRNVRFLPSMVNHLLDEPWTRTVAPETLAKCENGWDWDDPRWLEVGK